MGYFAHGSRIGTRKRLEMREFEKTVCDIRDLEARMAAVKDHAKCYLKPIIGMELEIAHTLVKDAVKWLEKHYTTGLKKN